MLSYYTSRGTVYYTPADYLAEKNNIPQLPAPPCRPRHRRSHSIHISRLPAGFVPYGLRPQPPTPEPKKLSRFRVELKKLATRENAKRVLGSIFFPFSSNPSFATSSAASPTASTPTLPETPETPGSLRSSLSLAPGDPSSLLARRIASGTIVNDIAMSRPSLSDITRSGSPRNSGSNTSISAASAKCEVEKPVCSGNGVACHIILAEPVIFLTGLDHDGTTRDSSSNATGSILRGKLQLNVTKSAKIKTITLKFTGRARTEWPEGMFNAKRACSIFWNFLITV